MNTFVIEQKINENFDGYQLIISLYDKFKNNIFDRLEIRFECEWFSSNLTAVLGGVLDKFYERHNDIQIKFKNSKQVEIIEMALKKNDFLSHFGFPRLDDKNNTIIK